LDVVPRQVMVEAIIAEVQLTKDDKLGASYMRMFSNIFKSTNTGQIIYNQNPSGFSTTPDTTASGFQGVLSGSNYSALIQALSTDNRVRVLASPRVFTSNNQQAEIDITENIPYINGQTLGSLTTNISNSVQFLDVGFTLNITPVVTEDGQVTMDVQQETSDLIGFDTLGTGASAVTAPDTNDRFTDTYVTINDGETVAISGLIRDDRTLTISKIPILSQIPIIGQFFRSRENSSTKVELMIFITPHVIHNAEEARKMTLKESEHIRGQDIDLPKLEPNLDPNKPHKVSGGGLTQPAQPGNVPPGNTTPGSGAQPSNPPTTGNDQTPPPTNPTK
jgi:general secretion pathway protein D